MPMIRKINLLAGRTKAVVLPKDWIDYYEREYGEPIKEVLLEVNAKITIEPYMPNREKELEEFLAWMKLANSAYGGMRKEDGKGYDGWLQISMIVGANPNDKGYTESQVRHFLELLQKRGFLQISEDQKKVKLVKKEVK